MFAAAAWHDHPAAAAGIKRRSPPSSSSSPHTPATTARPPMPDAFESLDADEPPPATPVWDMEDYVQYDSPVVIDPALPLTVSPSQLSSKTSPSSMGGGGPALATQHQNTLVYSPTLTDPAAPFTWPVQPMTTSSANENWFWDFSPASSPAHSAFASTTDLSSSTRSSAVFSHTFSLSPLAHQFVSLPQASSEPPAPSGVPDNAGMVYAHHPPPPPAQLPAQFMYGAHHQDVLVAGWPSAPGSHNLPISADGSVPSSGPSAIPIPAAAATTAAASFSLADFHYYKPPMSPQGFMGEEYAYAAVGGGALMQTPAAMMATATSLPNASELAAHMSQLRSAATGPASGPTPATGDAQGWRAGRRDKSLPPPLSRDRTITQRSIPAALRSPTQVAPPPSVLAPSLFTSPPLASRSPIFPVGADGSPHPPQLLFVNQTAQYSNAGSASSPPSQGESNAIATLEEQGYSSTSMAHFSRGQKKRKRLAIEEFEDDSEDRKLSDDTPSRSELRPPKQAPSMWQIFFADWLAKHKHRSPHDKLNVAQAAKEAGVEYKNLTDDEKEELKRRVYVEKEERERRLQAWQKTLTPEDIKRENKFRAAQRKAGLSRRANIKDPNAPKKPLSAYFMFLAAIRSDPNLVREVFGDEQETTRQSVLAAKRWRDMSDEEKRPFLTKAEHDKLQYEAARKVYEDRAGIMTGTGYIIPDEPVPDVAAAIFATRLANRDASTAVPTTTPTRSPKPKSATRYDPVSTKGRSAPVPISSAPITRRRNFAKRGVATQDENEHGTSSGLGSGEDSQESDEEWVPGSSY